MKHKIVSYSVMACGLLSSGAAMADIFASASLSDFRIVLVDTRPDDGIAPSVNFYGHDFLYSGASDDFSETIWTNGIEGNTPFDELSSANSDPFSSSSVSLSSNPSNGNLTYKASTYSKSDSGRHVSGGLYETNVKFSLQPGTAMFILADAEVGVDMTTGTKFHGNSAFAIISMSLTGPMGNGLTSSSTALLNDGQFIYRDGTYSNSQSMPMTLSYFNNDDVVDTGTFDLQLNAQAWAAGPATPIPEPGSAALMLAGLGALGWVRRTTASARR